MLRHGLYHTQSSCRDNSHIKKRDHYKLGNFKYQIMKRQKMPQSSKNTEITGVHKKSSEKVKLK